MPTTPLVLALCAAFVHAGWNLLLSRARDSEAAIAAYTLLDKQGLKHARPLSYLELVVGVPALIYAPLLARRRGLAALRAELSLASIVAGLGMFGAFGLALAAIRLAPSSSLAAVQAVRETSVVIAVVAARLVLHERVTGPRLAGAVAVVAGVAAIARA